MDHSIGWSNKLGSKLFQKHSNGSNPMHIENWNFLVDLLLSKEFSVFFDE